MFTRGLRLALLIAGVGCISSCGKDEAEAAPKGQVVAVADGIEITQREVAAETDLIGARLVGGDGDKVRQAALQQIIARKLLAREARTRKLDESPDFGLLKQRAEEAALETLLQRSMTRHLPEPTSADATRYAADNPDLFAQRKLFSVDQIRIPTRNPKVLVEKLKPLATLEEVQAMLERDGVRFRRERETLDAMQAQPALVKQILALPAEEIFVLPAAEGLTVNRIVETRTEPVQADEAQRFALNYLRQKGISDTLQNQLAEIMKKHKDKIRYQPGYEMSDAASGKPGG
ncbi:peptidyl-prolyl cis-trans isomerase, EpsD family [Rhizorhapis suberifaciens]|uniref:EpsD family peptidyl-prolyl cis-trans isomerase n=1 Tax=Rhizorhapis suberifaciens TaxID=13656 RepID=A0A840HWA8_9SPHN|nr:peptidyl-prolyl cis-trans isomerase, EpsD family [Rhizorhapis suberifaciens]MBB4641756.1 EpsD family peptidyl-prolyl cis-trans isomerase [Rhizorhapis suberifaciens]